MTWFDLGDVAVVPVVELERLLIDPEEFFPGLGQPDGPYFVEPWFDTASGSLVYRMQAFVVLTPAGVVLVDGCIGPGKERQRDAFNGLDDTWFTRFTATGLGRTEVDHVIFTHLHVDHVGWATWRHSSGQWEPVFPRAQHLVTSAEVGHWTSAAGAAAMTRTGDYVADSIAPIRQAGLLAEVPPDMVVNPFIRLRPASGHTPGSVCVEVEGSEGRLVLIGDVMHHPLQLVQPGLSTRYCVAPTEASRTRQRLLADAARDGTVLVPSHFAGDGAFRVELQDQGYRMVPATDMVRRSAFRRG